MHVCECLDNCATLFYTYALQEGVTGGVKVTDLTVCDCGNVS